MSPTTTDRPNGRVIRHDLWDLVARAQAGDSRAFGDLYAATRPQVYSCLLSRVRNHHTAEDLTSDTYIRAWRALPTLQPTTESPQAWLTIIAIRLSHTWHRDRRRKEISFSEIRGTTPEGRPETDDDGAPDTAADPVHAYLTAREIWGAAQKLSPGQRDALIGRFLLGLPTRETGEWMGGEPRAVVALTYRAVRALRRDPHIMALRTGPLKAGA